MKTFKISVLLPCLVSIFGFASAYALPAGTVNTAVESFQQADSKKWTKAERKNFKKTLKAKIKQERKQAKELRKKAKKAGKKVSKPQRDFSNRMLLIGLAIGIGLLVLSGLSSIFGLIGTLVVLIVIVLFLLRYF